MSNRSILRLFLSSVENCKHVKFDKDDRKGNRTGTQGSPGSPSPQGQQGSRWFNETNGEQGPLRITQINTTNAS